ncbi:MAG: serine/threonine-protein kinase, partial [Myxococcota bacterium]
MPPPSDVPDAGTAGCRAIELVGRGAYGDVYRGERESDGEPVAIKVLNDAVSKLGWARDLLRDEARILARIDHPSIVPVVGFAEIGGRPAIVMGWVPGADLEHVLAALDLTGERMPVPAALEVGAAVLGALHAACFTLDDHGAPLGIVHRDVKPSNIRLTPDGEVKVVDFGVARRLGDASSGATGLVGTEAYLAPERLSGGVDSPAADVYGAAVTVIELLTGRGLGRSPVAPDAHAHAVEQRMAAVRARLGWPADGARDALDGLQAALSADPTDRPSAAGLALATAARALPGERLRPFCRRFVPSIDPLLGRSAAPPSTPDAPNAPRVAPTVSTRAHQTLVPSDPAVFPLDRWGPGSRRLAVVVGLVAATAALCAVGLAGLASAWSTGAGTDAVAAAAVVPVDPRRAEIGGTGPVAAGRSVVEEGQVGQVTADDPPFEGPVARSTGSPLDAADEGSAGTVGVLPTTAERAEV